MRPWHDQEVTWSHGLNVEEGARTLVLVDESGGRLAPSDVAEDASTDRHRAIVRAVRNGTHSAAMSVGTRPFTDPDVELQRPLHPFILTGDAFASIKTARIRAPIARSAC